MNCDDFCDKTFPQKVSLQKHHGIVILHNVSSNRNQWITIAWFICHYMFPSSSLMERFDTNLLPFIKEHSIVPII